MEPFVSIQHVSFSYHTLSGETPALNDISFSVNPGEFVSIVGPSGCGKSTLLSLIAGLMKPDYGEIRVSGDNIGYMLQKDHLFEWRTIFRNVALGLEIQNKVTSETRSHLNDMLKAYGLEKFHSSMPSELSGGMRQRAALIRTLALEPNLLLLDEPFSALDYQTRLEVCDDVYQILKKEGKTAILVTHDLSEAISMGDKIIVLSRRPSSIRCILPISFNMENRTPFKTRNTPEFKDYFNTIWKELTHRETHADAGEIPKGHQKT